MTLPCPEVAAGMMWIIQETAVSLPLLFWRILNNVHNSFLVVCDNSTTCNGNGTCIGNTGICECNSGFTGDHCDIATCPGKPICSDNGTCPEGGVVCDCGDAVGVNDECLLPSK